MVNKHFKGNLSKHLLATEKGSVIEIGNQTLTKYQKHCKELVIFSRWEGIGILTEQITNWLTTSFQGWVSIDFLPDNFLAIECSNPVLRNRFLNGDILTYKGFSLECWE